MIRDLFEQKPQLKKIVLYVLIALVALILIIALIPLFTGSKLTYEELENKIKEASIKYYQTNERLLPSDGNIVKLSYNTLENEKLVKPIDKYLKGSSCSAEVIVKNTKGIYSYTPYLNCGNDYKTKELHKQVLEDNPVVTSKDGLYSVSSKYIFRGEEVNNYVEFAGKIWRIISIDSDNTIKLIENNSEEFVVYDDRYNSKEKYNFGKNDYNLSRIKDNLKKLYDNSEFLSDDDKSKLTSKPFCLDAKNKDANLTTNLIPCNSTLENEFIGLLTVDEYIYISLDEKCKGTSNEECQNYNYLANNESNDSWWTITPNKDNTHQVFYIRNFGTVDISNCSNTFALRPVVNLDSNVIFASGKGTSEEPYKIK